MISINHHLHLLLNAAQRLSSLITVRGGQIDPDFTLARGKTIHTVVSHHYVTARHHGAASHNGPTHPQPFTSIHGSVPGPISSE